MCRRLLCRALARSLSWAVPLVFLRPTAAPYAVRFRRNVVLGVPGLGLRVLSHDEAQALAEQLDPKAKQ